MEHLYDEDGDLSLTSKLWFLDVCDGRVDLLPEQAADFEYLRCQRRDGKFFESSAEAFMIEFPRIQALFYQWVQDAAE